MSSAGSEDEIPPVYVIKDIFSYADPLSGGSLLDAVCKNDLQRVVQLVKAGKSLNINDNRGFTPLHLAVLNENLAIFEYLLSQPEINLDNRSHEGVTPLLLSIRRCHDSLFSKKLIEAGADVHIPDLQEETPLHEAVKKFHDVCHMLILKDANINALDFDLYTPLHEAVIHSDYEMVSMLLYYGADADSACSNGLTPFMMAVHLNVDVEIQKLLLEYESDFSRITIDDYSTLLLALNSSSPLALDIVQRGANVNYCNEETNALQLSLYLENTDIFSEIWSKFDYNNVYGKQNTGPLLANLCRFIPFKQQLAYIWIMLSSDYAFQIVHDYCDWEGSVSLFSYLIELLHDYNADKDDVHSLVCTCLSLGVNLYLTDVELILRWYGINETFKLCLHMDIKNDYLSIKNPLLSCIYEVNCDPNSILNDYEVPLRCNNEVLKDITILLKFCTPPYEFKQQLYNIDCSSGQLHNKLDCVTLPSLTELSRNKAREFICRQFRVKSCAQFYTVLKHMCLPPVIKKIIGFELPVNK